MSLVEIKKNYLQKMEEVRGQAYAQAAWGLVPQQRLEPGGKVIHTALAISHLPGAASDW